MTNEELVYRIQKNISPRESMEELYNQTKGIIFDVVKRLEGLADKEDLAQEGFLALSKAAMCYDPSKGMSFASYARNRVRWWLLRYIENDSTIRLPSGVCQQIRIYNNVREKLTHRLSREPSDEEIRAVMRLTPKQYQTVLKCLSLKILVSLDETVDDDEDTSRYELIPTGEDMEGDVVDQEVTERLKNALWRAVDELPEKQSAVIRTRYQGGKRQISEVSEELGLTYNQAHDIEQAALKWLRSYRYRQWFQPYLDDYFLAWAYRRNSAGRFRETWTSTTEQIAMKLFDNSRNLSYNMDMA